MEFPFTIEQGDELERRISISMIQMKHEFRAWIFSTVLVNLIAIIPITFYIGGIYNQITDSIQIQKEMGAELNQRAKWMQNRERWEYAIETEARRHDWELPPSNPQ